jgi:hypothetical protein
VVSDPLWINAAADTAVGTATIEADDELLTITAHGLVDGDRVVVSNLTGGAVGAIADGGVYWVVGAGVNTFAISLTRGGLPIEFTVDGGADVDRFQPGYAAAELRRAQGMFLLKGVTDRFGARQGIHPSNDPAVTVAGTTWTVEDLVAVVYPGIGADDGPYVVQHLEESGSLDPADGGSDRLDGLDLQIRDDDIDSSGFRHARVAYTAGSPGSGIPPSVAANALRLATILVPSGGAPVPSVATLGEFTVASGGILPVRDSTELPAAGRYEGLYVDRADLDTLDRWTGAAWETIAARELYNRLGPYQPKIKSANETVVSSTVLQNDDALFFLGLEPGSYICEMNIPWDADQAADWKWRLNYSGTVTWSRGQFASSRDTTATPPSTITAFSLNQDVAVAGNGAGSVLGATIHIGFNVSTSGDLRFQWAQNASSANNTVVRQGAYMRLEKVA